MPVFIIALLLVLGISKAELASKSWEKDLLTPDSSDLVSSVALGGYDDGAHGYAIIAGTVKAPRGSHTSLEAIVNVSGLAHPTVEPSGNASSVKHTDAFVSRISTPDGSVEWVHRLGGDGGHVDTAKTRYFGVELDENRSRIYAVGHQRNTESSTYDPLLTILDSSSGEFISSTHYNDSSTRTNGGFASITYTVDALYLCGSDTASQSKGGVLVIKTDLDGKFIWKQQVGENRVRDRCAGVSVSNGTGDVVVAARVYEDTESSRAFGQQPTAQAAIYGIAASTGMVQWSTLIPRSANVQEMPTGIAAGHHGIYVSSTKWISEPIGKRMYVSKLSGSNGQLVWSKEVCCGELMSSLPSGGNFHGKASSESSKGISLGNDGYVYVHGYYRARDGSADDTFASVVSRISIFGEQDASKDISPALDNFRYEWNRPIMMARTSGLNGAAVVERVGDAAGSDEESNNVRVVGLELEDATPVSYLQSEGNYYTSARVKLSQAAPEKAPLETVKVLIADLTRVSPEQVSVRVDSRDGLVMITVTAFHDDPERSTEDGKDIVKLLREAVSTSAGSDLSPVQSSLELDSGALVKETTVEVVKTGVYADTGALNQLGFVEGDEKPDAASDSPRTGDTTTSEKSGGCIDRHLLPSTCKRVHLKDMVRDVMCISKYSPLRAEKEVCTTPFHVVVFDGIETTTKKLCESGRVECRRRRMFVNSCMAYTQNNIAVTSRLQITHYSTSWKKTQLVTHIALNLWREVLSCVLEMIMILSVVFLVLEYFGYRKSSTLRYSQPSLGMPGHSPTGLYKSEA